MIQRTCAAMVWMVWAAAVPATDAAPLNGREAQEDVFYHFMPIAWRDSDNDTYRFGDFGGMTASLDYLEDLGITAVWMNPIFPSPAYHGYQHGPADEINARLGTEAEFLSFVQAAHARGIKVFLDLVVYGISQDSIWFQDAYGNPGSPYDDWLAFTNSGNTQYLGSTYTTWNGDTVGFIHWNLNNANPTALVTGWSQKWLDPDENGDPSDGIDGYRLDHVWERYSSGPNGWGYNLDDFWVPWKAALQTVNPDVFTFAEQADWGITGANLLPAFDATMTKPFEFAARDALANEQAGNLYSSMAATLASLPAGKIFVGIIGDHDVDRLASVIGTNFEKGKAAAAVLLTQPFPPVLYHGDEIGMLGVKGNYGGDANDIPMREPFKWNAVAGPPMSNYWILNSQAYNNAYSSDNDGRSVEEQDGTSGSLLEEYKLLIAARKAHVALRRGSYHAVTADSSRIWAFLRHQDGEETLLVAINVYGNSRTPDLDLSSTDIPGGSTTVQDVITGEFLPNLTDANKAAYSLTLPGYHYRILAVNLTPGEPPSGGIDGADIPEDFGANRLVATQDNATGLGDNISELNQLFVRPGVGGFHLGITGNLATDGTGLVLLFDTISGGQNPLDTEGYPDPFAVSQMDGLVLDAGFEPDHMVYVNTYSGTIYVDQFTLPSSGSTTKTYHGAGTVNDGDGFLTGGSNPNGMQIAMNNTNAAGVTDTDASGAVTATTGFEMFIPYADVGASDPPDGPIGLVAYLVRSSGEVSNQWLPGLGGGYENLGFAPDLTEIPGQQYAAVSLDVPGDWDGDGDVDLIDAAAFVDCLAGPNVAPTPTPPATPQECLDAFDADADGDVDAGDFAAFQIGFTG